ncbi:MAG TPA: DUF5675 family protein [Urbifossiella sp.]|nr:DUF5675 family protein [Urbifossiella sp.]
MSDLFLRRTISSDKGTFGVLTRNGKTLCVTCEDPWRDNARGESCIPAGRYRCVGFNGAKYKDVWEVTGVPNRTAILIHAGNTMNDTRGCILVGKRLGEVDGLPAVLDSRSALDALRLTLPREFWLTVIDRSPE